MKAIYTGLLATGLAWANVNAAPSATFPAPGLSPLRNGAPALQPVFSLNNPPGPQFSEAEKQAQLQAGTSLKSLIQDACKNGAASVTIPPGNYRFPSSRPGALVLENLQRGETNPFTIVATGATFWFDLPDVQLPSCPRALVFKNCSNVVLEGLTLDRGSRGCMEGKIVQIDYAHNRLEIQASPGTFIPTTLNGKQRLIPFKADGRFCAPLYYLQSGGKLNISTITEGTQRGRYWAVMAKPDLLNLNRNPQWIAAYGNLGTLAPGDGFHMIYTVAEALRLEKCKKMTIRDVKNHIPKGCTVEAGGYGGHLWQRYYAGPRPGTNQLQGGDGMMVNCLRHGSTYDSITLVATTDDPMNIHGNWGIVAGTPVGHTITFTARQAGGDAAIGDIVNFYNRDTGAFTGSASVTSLAKGNTFTLDAPTELFAGCYADWPQHDCANWVIKNSTFRDCYQRLLVYTGPGKVLNSNFIRLGHAVMIQAEFNSSNEGGIPNRIEISGNTFTDVNPRPNGAAVQFAVFAHGNIQDNLLDGLTVTNNHFNVTQPACMIAHAKNVFVASNWFAYPSTANAPMLQYWTNRQHQPIGLKAVSNGLFRANQLSDPAGYTSPGRGTGSRLLGSDERCQAITLDGKQILP